MEKNIKKAVFLTVLLGKRGKTAWFLVWFDLKSSFIERVFYGKSCSFFDVFLKEEQNGGKETRSFLFFLNRIFVLL